MIKNISIVLGLCNGDEGKGAVAYELCKRSEYTHCMKSNGGSNAGHTIYHKGKKFITHQIPIGIFHHQKCIIGSGCVININKLFKEIQDLENFGINTKNRIFIAKNAHIVTDLHIKEEETETRIGTTRQGIMPCIRDKYSRIGLRAESCKELQPYLIDLYEYLYESKEEINLLVEMGQGFNLDIDHGDYPFVTSSHTTAAGALLNLLPWNKVNKVYGVSKVYDTYVGSKSFQPNELIFDELCELGQEIGATTGRKRQCNWINIDNLQKAINVNCVTHLVVSKLDILEELNLKHDNKYWNIYSSKLNKIFNFPNKKEFCKELSRLCDKTQFRRKPDEGVYI